MNVMMIGFSGTGKTSYMGAMYGQWNNESSDSFSVRAKSDSQHLNLLSLSNKLKRGRYPTGTDMLDRYDFTLAYKGCSILDFSWIDYRGGVLSERGSSEMQSVISAINGAHALIVFLDMTQFVSNPSGTGLIVKRLSRLLQNALSDIQNRCNCSFPISIVLTKADMVTDFDAIANSKVYKMLIDIISSLRENEQLSIMLTLTAINADGSMGVQYPFVHSLVWGLAEYKTAMDIELGRMAEREERLRNEGGFWDEIWSSFKGEKSKCDLADEEWQRMQQLDRYITELQNGPIKDMAEYLSCESGDKDVLMWLF